MSQVRKAEKRKNKAWWPIYGLVMAGAAGAIAYVLAPEVLSFVERRAPNFSMGALPREQVILLFGAVIFFIIIAIGGMIIAAFMPRKKDEVQDAFLKKQKQDMVKDEKSRRVRRAIVERELKKNNKRIE